MLSNYFTPQAHRGPGRRDRPRLRQARPDLRRAPRRAAGDHREAARRQPRPGRADERHRRRQGKRAIIVDDEIDTAGTLIEIVRALEREGVTEIYACATHGVLSAIRPSTGSRHSALREVVLTDSIPLPRAQAARQDHDAVGRAAHRRGDQAHPPRRVGRRAVLERGLAHPGDAPLGGWRRGHDRHPRRRRAPMTTDEPSPSRAASRRRQATDDASSSTDPTARAASSRARSPTPDWRDAAPVAALGHEPRGRAPAQAQEPGDEPDVAVPVRAVLARARRS